MNGTSILVIGIVSSLAVLRWCRTWAEWLSSFIRKYAPSLWFSGEAYLLQALILWITFVAGMAVIVLVVSSS